MKPAHLQLFIDEIVIDQAIASSPQRLQRALSREIARRLESQHAPLPEGAATAIGVQVEQAIRVHLSSPAGRGRDQT